MNSYEKKPGILIRTLIIDDQQLIRLGLKAMLYSFRKELEFEIHEMDNGEKALQYLNHAEADLVIIEYKLEGINGAQTIERILRFRPGMKILALSYYNEYPVITAMLEAGALGYVLKNVQPEELLIAIKAVLAGKKYLCSDTALVMLTATEEKNSSGNISRYKISGRELEVLRLIVQGLNNAEIAEQLFLNRRTIDTHRQNLLKKMKVNNTAGLVRLAIELRLLE